MATVTNLTAILSVNNSKFKKGIKDSKGALGGFQKSIGSIGPAIAGAFAVGKLISFGQEALNLYNIQAQAEQQLLVALDGRKTAQEGLIRQAQRLQKETLFGDEETIKAQALIAAFVEEEEQIKQVIPLVQDLATAKGMSLAGAADLVSKTLGSSTNALSRYGVQVEGTVGSTERLNSLMKGLNDAFGGQAVAAAQAGTGAIIQFKNAMGDLKEEIGGVLAVPFTQWATDATEAIALLSSESSSFGDKFVGMFGGVGYREARRATVGIKEFADEIIAADEALAEGGETVTDEMAKQAREARLAAEAWDEYQKTIGKGVEKELSAIDATELLNAELRGLTRTADQMTSEVLKGVSSDFQGLATDAVAFEGSLMDLGLEIADLDEEIVESEAWEKLADNMNDAKERAKELKSVIVDTMVSVGTSIATTAGEFAAGVKTFGEALKEIGAMILAALGDILIMVGMSTSPIGIPLVMAGIALKGIGAFVGNSNFGEKNQVQSISVPKGYNTNSTLYGNDIRTANNYATDLYGRVG